MKNAKLGLDDVSTFDRAVSSTGGHYTVRGDEVDVFQGYLYYLGKSLCCLEEEALETTVPSIYM